MGKVFIFFLIIWGLNFNIYRMSSKLVPYAPLSEAMGIAANDGFEGILRLHFRNGIDSLSINPRDLQEKRDALSDSLDRDRKAYAELVVSGEQDFKQGLSWRQRHIWGPGYVAPAQEPSTRTRVLSALVKMGEVLTEQVQNLKKLPQLAESMLEEQETLSHEAARVERNVYTLTDRLHEAKKEADVNSSLLTSLESYNQLSLEKRSDFVGGFRELYGSIPIEDTNVRTEVCQRLRNAMFSVGQLMESYSSDMRVERIRLESILERLRLIQRDSEVVWKVYNPAREAVAKLKAEYDVKSSVAQRGLVLSDVTGFLVEADSLCEDATSACSALEIEVEARLEVAGLSYALGNSSSCAQLTPDRKPRLLGEVKDD